MTNAKKILFAEVAVVAILAAGALLYLLIKSLAAPAEKATGEQAIDVIVETAGRGAITDIRTFNANIEPFYDVDVTPQIQGLKIVSLVLMRRAEEPAAPAAGESADDAARLLEEFKAYKPVEKDGALVEVAENVEVREGDIVAVLDYEGLEAEMKIAWADYLQAVRTRKEKLSEKERWERLYEEGKGPATEQQRDKAVWEYDVAIEDANSNKATFESKAWDYKQAFVKAPFDGVVSVRYADKGAVLVSGKPLLRLIHLDRLKVMASVPNRYIGADGIRAGVTKVEIVLESEGGSAAAGNGVITATVTKVYEESNRPTRANPIEIDINNAKDGGDYKIRGNMYARVSFFVRTVEDAVRVRSDAIFEIEKDKYVFVVEDGVARRKKIETGIREKGFVEVVGGLNGGEKVVVVGQNKLAEGTKVNVVSEEYNVAPVRE